MKRNVTTLARTTGLFASRPNDQLGVGLIAALLSADYSNSSVAAGRASADTEYTVELAYQAAVTPWFIIQPDLQVVIDPAGDNSRDPVWITGLRTVVQF